LNLTVLQDLAAVNLIGNMPSLYEINFSGTPLAGSYNPLVEVPAFLIPILGNDWSAIFDLVENPNPSIPPEVGVTWERVEWGHYRRYE
jgi:hypothetical protein